MITDAKEVAATEEASVEKKAGPLAAMFKKMTLKRAPKAAAVVESVSAVEEVAPTTEVSVSTEAVKVFLSIYSLVVRDCRG